MRLERLDVRQRPRRPALIGIPPADGVDVTVQLAMRARRARRALCRDRELEEIEGELRTAQRAAAAAAGEPVLAGTFSSSTTAYFSRDERHAHVTQARPVSTASASS